MCRQACILGVTAKIDDDSVPGKVLGVYIYIPQVCCTRYWVGAGVTAKIL